LVAELFSTSAAFSTIARKPRRALVRPDDSRLVAAWILVTVGFADIGRALGLVAVMSLAAAMDLFAGSRDNRSSDHSEFPFAWAKATEAFSLPKAAALGSVRRRDRDDSIQRSG
jgi:hypothetical protein